MKLKTSTELTVEDLQEAERCIDYCEQRKAFQQEINSLKQGHPCVKTSTLCKLDPIMDQDILRVGGRLNKMALPSEMKNPIILPKNSHISRLILQQIHLE